MMFLSANPFGNTQVSMLWVSFHQFRYSRESGTTERAQLIRSVSNSKVLNGWRVSKNRTAYTQTQAACYSDMCDFTTSEVTLCL